MLVLGMAFVFAGYSVSSYGWVLLRGYDIPFREWMSPLHPYTWPQGTPPVIPATQLFPGSSSSWTPGGPVGKNAQRGVNAGGQQLGGGSGNGTGTPV